MPLTPWHLLLILGVPLQVTSVAYLRSPRWKALALTLPVPFTLIALTCITRAMWTRWPQMQETAELSA